MTDPDYKDIMDRLETLRLAKGYEKNGKKFLTVAQRVDFFRHALGVGYGIDTDVRAFEDGMLVMAKVTQEGSVIGSGMIFTTWEGTHPIPTAETKAIGRALASIGFSGGEYPSYDEMRDVDDKPVDRSSSGHRETPEEFRQAVKEVFPEVGGYDFYVPLDNSPDEIDKAFAEVDRIADLKELTAYHHALQEFLAWVKPDIASEMKATFKTRSKQLKG